MVVDHIIPQGLLLKMHPLLDAKSNKAVLHTHCHSIKTKLDNLYLLSKFKKMCRVHKIDKGLGYNVNLPTLRYILTSLFIGKDSE